MEATGGIEMPCVEALDVEDLPLVVVNPKQIQEFAKSNGRIDKTDVIDAQTIAHFGEAVRLAIQSGEARLLRLI